MAMESSATAGNLLTPPKAPLGAAYLDRAVTITVLSCDGVVTKRYEPKLARKKNRQVTKTTTSLVASFSQTLSANSSFLTHVPSMPMEHLDESCTKPDKAKSIPQPTVKWPSMDVGEVGGETLGQELSTLRFTRRFDEKNISETFPISLSLSRCGKMISLGRADVIISVKEKRHSYVNVPISSTIKKVGVSSPMKNKSSSKNRIPMVRVKGDNLQFGLKDCSVLSVLVSVTDVQEQDDTNDVQENELMHNQDFEEVTNDDDECEVNDVTFELDDKYENILDFLNEAGDDAIDLSSENDDIANCDEEEKVDCPRPEGVIDGGDIDDDEQNKIRDAPALPQDEDEESKINDAPAVPQDEDEEKVVDALNLQLDEGEVDEGNVDEDEETVTDVPALPQNEADECEEDEETCYFWPWVYAILKIKSSRPGALTLLLDGGEVDAGDVNEDKEKVADAPALPHDSVGEQKVTVENTDEEQEEISIVESVEEDTNNNGTASGMLLRLFGYMQTSSL
ncbi:hypothetical protein QTG54_007036 [Skeletonema marinoi]|uniref:Uncharacterized protein n=1 Tax=Skeletonema marinoi TaxID=267567 RepID=A0AAD8YBX0_9STRA|nr:hypothetical protein QTG54_007036 [Skeletonema marinoi]